jgi:hypothetical protein
LIRRKLIGIVHEDWLLKGDNNTKFFHKIANGRKRKNTIISLEHEGNIIKGDTNLLEHDTNYYAELFGPGEEHGIHINSSMWAELDQVSEADNIMLSKPFSKEEVKTTLFQMEKNKVAGPDKIPIEFYQVCWGLSRMTSCSCSMISVMIKLTLVELIMALSHCFQKWKMPQRFNNLDLYVC